MTDMSIEPKTVFVDVASGSQIYPVDPTVSQEDDPQDVTETDLKGDESKQTSDPYLQIQPRKINCTECNRFTAENEEKMLRHIRKVHRGENPFQCYLCDYSTYNKVLFEEHVRIHQGIKPYKCAHCPYRSVSKKNTKKHEQIHRPDNPHKCDQCGFIARHLRSLQHHLLTHAESLSAHQCSLCKKKFANAATYNRHNKGKRRCPECEDIVCKTQLTKHRNKRHGVQNQKKSSNLTKKSVFVCAICAWEGNIKPRILLHLIHHPNQEVDDEIVDTLILRKLGIMEERSDDTTL